MQRIISFVFLVCLALSSAHCSDAGGSSTDGDSAAATEDDFEELAKIALEADAQFAELAQSAPTMDDARQQLVDWLMSQDGVTEAGVADDDLTVWFYHQSGMTSGVLTENSFANGSSAPLSPGRSAEFGDRESRQGLSPRAEQAARQASSTVGMMAWFLSPFYTENSSDDKIYAVADLYKEPALGQRLYEPFIDGDANIAAFQAALIGFFPPAAHLTVITHGGRTRLKKGAQKVSYVVSGEYKTDSTWTLYGEEFRADRLITKAYKGKLWLTMTPGFFAQYSAKPDPGDAHWMARYVHFLSCSGFRDNSLRDVFMNSGAQTFSGFTHSVDVEWGNKITLEYFEKLAEGEGRTIAEARGALSATSDPNSTRCKFEQWARAAETRYYYRASVVVDGNTYLTPASSWTPVTNNDPGYVFTGNVYHATTGELGGVLTVIFETTAGGSVATEDTVTEIMLSTPTDTWFVDHQEWEDKGLTGVVEVTTFDNRNGGQVIGSFDGTLINSSTEPYDSKQIGGNFELIRSFAAGS